MKRTTLLIGLILAIIMIGFVYAQSSGSGGGGPSQSLGLSFSQPTNGSTVDPSAGADKYALVIVEANTEVVCDFSGKACNGDNCRDINYRKCIFCGLENTYYDSQSSEWDKVAGWKYHITATCTDRDGVSDSETVTFDISGDINSDTTSPEMTVESPINNVKHYLNADLDFELNELAHCEYTLARGSGAGKVSIPGYITTYKKSLFLSYGKEYTLTLTCEDLNENTASKIITFTSVDESSSGSGGGGGPTTETPDEEEVEEKIEEDTSAPIETYYKSCNYIWDSSRYVNQEVKITATITDSAESRDSDSVTINVIDGKTGMGGAGRPFDENALDIQINSPRGNVGAGAVEIELSARGNNELGDVLLSFQSGRTGGGFKISDRNCVSSGSGGGGGPGVSESGSGGGGGPTVPSTCEKYHICPGSEEIQYCSTYKTYNEDGELVGAGCGCKSNPEELCIPTPTSGSGGGGGPTGVVKSIPGSGSGGGPIGTNENPIICDGCILGDKCVFVGYRANDKYCELSGEFEEQKEADSSCENNFECGSNLCIDDQCISSSLWQRILNFFRRLFGIE